MEEPDRLTTGEKWVVGIGLGLLLVAVVGGAMADRPVRPRLPRPLTPEELRRRRIGKAVEELERIRDSAPRLADPEWVRAYGRVFRDKVLKEAPNIYDDVEQFHEDEPEVAAYLWQERRDLYTVKFWQLGAIEAAERAVVEAAVRRLPGGSTANGIDPRAHRKTEDTAARIRSAMHAQAVLQPLVETAATDPDLQDRVSREREALLEDLLTAARTEEGDDDGRKKLA